MTSRRKVRDSGGGEHPDHVDDAAGPSDHPQHDNTNGTKNTQNGQGKEEQGSDVTNRDGDMVIVISRFQLRALIVCTSLLILLIAIAAGLMVQDGSPHWTPDPEDFQKIGPEALALFRQHDVDDDGALDLREFEPLAHILVDVNISLTYELPIEPEDNLITIGAHFKPLNISTMQIIDNNYFDMLGPELKPLSALKEWTTPNIELKNFATKNFAVFAPRKGDPKLGKPYSFTPFGPYSNTDDLERKFSIYSSNRFYPPRVSGELQAVHNLLAMLHPRPFLNPRFPPHGSLACVRAYSDDLLDISFRIHAEFQIQETPHRPFWFTPAQFKGRLIISRDHKTVKYFRVYVPNNRRLNVDMEWLKNDAEDSMEVDIGYMEQMELRSTGPSRPATYEGYDIRQSLKPETDSEEVVDDLTWTKEVQVDMCERAMEVEFYPFKKVPYYNFTEAHELASKEDKLVHTIALWGALDDQSC